jgi:hypothetical protein
MKKFKKSIMIFSIIILFSASGLSTAKATEAETVKDKRYEVFMVNPLPACNPTTMTFRSDNILVIECMDGFGTYMPVSNFFVAFYQAPDFYLGKDATIFLTGFALDPFIIAGGVAYIGDDTETVLITGYLLSN